MYKYEKSCGAVIFKDDLVLLIENKRSLHWSFPKGHKEMDETDVQTALREVLEETNVKIKLYSNHYCVINYEPKPKVSKDVVYFLAEYDGGELKAQDSEVTNIGWFTIEEAMNKITYQQEKEVLESLLKVKPF